MLTWAQFVEKVKVFLTVDADRLGSESQVPAYIRVGCVQLQDAIDYYRAGHESTWEFDDVTRSGFTSEIPLPEGAYLRELYHVKLGETAIERPLYWYPYLNRRDLIAGTVNVRRAFRFTTDPRARSLWVYPALAAGYSAKLVWDGVRDDFADGDLVPFDEEAAMVVSEFVKSKLALTVEKNPALAATFNAAFVMGLRHLRIKCRDRLMELTSPGSTATCVPGFTGISSGLCVPCSGAGESVTGSSGCVNPISMPSLEWAMIGDSGDAAMAADTDLVTSTIRALNPSLIWHLGDTNYPAGSDVTIGDSFTRHFWSWVKSGDIFASYGNHDLMTNYGAPLTGILLAQQAVIGASRIADAKLWFSVKRGPVEFFSINSGLDGSDAIARLNEQYAWLRAALAASTATWKVVVLHRAPYSSDAIHSPGATEIRWPFRSWGADIVVSAHGHTYERLLVDGLPYLVCGLGGAPRYAFGPPVAGSQFRWAGDVGYLRCTADDSSLQVALVNARTGAIIDRVTLEDDGAGVSATGGDNYQFTAGLLQIFNVTTSGFSTIRLVGPSDMPNWALDAEGTSLGPLNYRWADSTCLQIWNSSASTWHPIYYVGTDTAPTIAIGAAGEVGANARIDGDQLQFINQTTGNYKPIYLYGTPPTIA